MGRVVLEVDSEQINGPSLLLCWWQWPRGGDNNSYGEIMIRAVTEG